MTSEEIDRALSDWNGQLATVADNLLELQGDATYQLLTGSGGAAKLELRGETAGRVLPVLASMQTLFQHFGLLQEMVERVAALRRELRPVFGREQDLRQMQALLQGESIKVPEAAVPLEKRTLLSGLGGLRGVRPDELLGRMVEAFAACRDAVTSVSAAWEELAVDVEAAEAELAAYKRQAAGAGVSSEVAAAEALLAALKAEVTSDPLRARVDLRTRFRPALEAASRQIRLRLQVQAQAAAAYALLEQLQVCERERALAVAASLGRIVIPAPAASAPTASASVASANGEIEGLRAWLGRLEQRGRDERPEAIDVGLRNWHRAADGLLKRETECLRLARLPLETRRELRGRLEALKAKARAYGLAEDGVFAGLAGEAEALLYTRPTDLVRAAAAVEAYEHRLRRGNSVPQPEWTARGEQR